MQPKNQLSVHVLDNTLEIALFRGWLADQRVGAIVIEANERLGDVGLRSAILMKGGPQVEDDRRRILSERKIRNVGDAFYTSGGTLPCRYVIHTVGPDGRTYERESYTLLLRRACLESFRLAANLELSSIALCPNINYSLPQEQTGVCAQVLFKAVEEFSSNAGTLREVRIVISSPKIANFFREEFAKRYSSSNEATCKTINKERTISDEKEKGLHSINSGKS